MRRGRILILIGLILALGTAAAVYVLLQGSQAPPPEAPRERVVVAVQPIDEDEPIEGRVEVQSKPVDTIPEGAVRSLDVLDGYADHLLSIVDPAAVIATLAAALGIILGLAISYAMIGFLGGIFNTAAQQVSSELTSSLFTFRFHVAPTSVVIAYALGVLFTFAVVSLSSWRVSRLNIVQAIRDRFAARS